MNRYLIKIVFFLFSVLIYESIFCQDQSLYVTQGSLSNIGSSLEPFSKPQDALQAIRKIRSSKKNIRQVNVWFNSGIYELDKTLLLNDPVFNNVTFKVAKGAKVILVGGKKILPSDVKNISVDESNYFTDKNAVSKIRVIDLKKSNIHDYGEVSITGFRRPYTNASMELFINGQPYYLARFPNDSTIKLHDTDIIDNGFIEEDSFYLGKIKYDKEKLKHWKNRGDMIAAGNFRFAWATDQLRINKIDTVTGAITFKDEHMWGFSGDNSWNQYYFFNVLEELDTPGEYYIDRENSKLYFYPYKEIKSTDTILVSTLEDALVTMKGVKNVKFDGIQFECGRGIGIYMEETENCTVKNATIKNFGVVGVCIGKGSVPSNVYKHPADIPPYHFPNEKLSERLGSWHELIYENSVFNRDAGKNNEIINCKIENTGKGGISLSGGDRITLQTGNNCVYNCEFTNTGRLDYSYKAPVNIDGVGNKIQHCQFNRCPATAIYVHGNDHLIEYNKIEEACHDVDDQGAIYIGRDPSEFGNIIRYNYFKNIGTYGLTMAVYYDDGACGTDLYSNVFYNAGSKTVMVGGGSYNKIHNNIFINNPLAITIDNRLDNWAKNKAEPGKVFDLRLNAVKSNEPPYSKHYPQLVNYLSNNPGTPKGNDIENNVFVNIKTPLEGKPEWGPYKLNYVTNDDPGFVNAAAQNFELKKTSVVYKKLPAFKAIPFSSIGLIKK